MGKQNNEDIKEHYDLKFNSDKKGLIAISFLLLIPIILLALFYNSHSSSQCLKDKTNFYLFSGTVSLIFLTMIVGIGLGFNNNIN